MNMNTLKLGDKVRIETKPDGGEYLEFIIEEIKYHTLDTFIHLKMKDGYIGVDEMEYKTGSINTASTQTENKRTLYEDKLKELYAELDRLDLHVEILTKRLTKILPNESVVETPPDVQKQFPVPLIAEMENIRDRISTATNRLMFLHEHSAI